jgi:hypothetical protein
MFKPFFTKKNEMLYKKIHKHIQYYKAVIIVKMQTRSQTRSQQSTNSALFQVDIDFDGASEAWKSNKKSTGNGCYKYVCQQITKYGTCCKRESLANSEFCKMHNKK